MTEAKRPSGDRHFYAIAISRWDNEGGATEEKPPHLAVSFTSGTAGAAATFVAHTVERKRA
jgi:hypothetical protein